jgi:hypothetical protein
MRNQLNEYLLVRLAEPEEEQKQNAGFEDHLFPLDVESCEDVDYGQNDKEKKGKEYYPLD